MSVHYEWSIESSDEHGDIHDLNFSDKLSFFKPADLTYDPKAGEFRKELVLVRTVGTDEDGVTDRDWATMTGGTLPTEFDGGETVPQRFHKELARWVA